MAPMTSELTVPSVPIRSAPPDLTTSVSMDEEDWNMVTVMQVYSIP